ncbi:hypothetical protein Vafri_6343 [Volvox africanus]|uniref:Phosphatidate cytidylyltransferase n=1 Tax=Volvox africanus TaxID=51714 RepID=A0A8J4AY04_9CHLO|nr:hypothetical protein Vafri_6343 [Volvox africanus]
MVRTVSVRGSAVFSNGHFCPRGARHRPFRSAGSRSYAVLCFGDGAAELAGRRWGRTALWYNPKKTWAGTLACLIAGMVGATAYTSLFSRLELYDRPVGLGDLAAGCMLSATAAAVAESLPLEGDNLTVPLAAVLTAVWYFGF